MDKVAPYDQIGVTPTPDFINANPGAGIKGSIINAVVFNALQDELLNVQDAAGLTRDPNDYTQVLRAIRSGLLEYYSASGTANAITIAPSPAHTSMRDGLHIRVKMAAAPTGPATLQLNSLAAVPIVRRAGSRLVGNDWAAGDIVDFVYSQEAGAFQVAGLLITDISQYINRPTFLTFYVNGSTGSDSNNGLSPSAAFATLQGAVNAISSGYLTTGQVTINVAAGTYAGFTLTQSNIASWNFSGNTQTPSSVIIQSPSTATNSGRSVIVNAGVHLTIAGFKFQSYLENVLCTGPVDVHGSCVWTAPSYGNWPTIGCFGVGYMSFTGGTQTYSGSMYQFLSTGEGSQILMGYHDPNVSYPVVFAASGTTSMSGAFLNAFLGATISVDPTMVTFTGTVTGSRYSATSNGVISTSGSGASYLPGSTAGSTGTGGQYI